MKDTFTQDLNQEEFIIATVDGIMLMAKGYMQEVYTQQALNVLWGYYLECEEFENQFNKVA